MNDAYRIGVARVDITPPLTIPYLGFVPRHARFRGVHDRLFAKAVVIGDGERRIALVVADSIGFARERLLPGRDFIGEVRDRIVDACGIAPDHVMIAATHAHSAPDTLAFRRLLDHDGAAAWLEVLAGQLTSAVVMAEASQKPARLKLGIGEARGISHNRRVLRRDGTLVSCGGKPNPGEVEEWGPVDPQVGLLAFEPDDGTPGACLVHFACHPVTVQVQPQISADFPGALCDIVEHSGVHCGDCLFLQGACADINPVRDTSDFADVRRYGQVLAGEVIKQLGLLSAPDHPTSPVRARAAAETVTVPSREIPDASALEQEYQAAQDALRQARTDVERQSAEKSVQRLEEARVRVRWGDAAICLEIQVMRVGDAILVGIPGEPFCEMGRALRDGQGDLQIFCVGYANGYCGYIAPPSVWERGGYEVRLGPWSVVGPEAFTIVLEAARSLIQSLV